MSKTGNNDIKIGDIIESELNQGGIITKCVFRVVGILGEDDYNLELLHQGPIGMNSPDAEPDYMPTIRRAMRQIGMTQLPEVIGDEGGAIASGSCICAVCGHEYREHPLDPRILGYDDRPYLNVLCCGSRVKL